MARRSKPAIDDELIDQLLEGRKHSAALLGNDGLIGEPKKRLADNRSRGSFARKSGTPL